jgi:hypothetical protein
MNAYQGQVRETPTMYNAVIQLVGQQKQNNTREKSYHQGALPDKGHGNKHKSKIYPMSNGASIIGKKKKAEKRQEAGLHSGNKNPPIHSEIMHNAML